MITVTKQLRTETGHRLMNYDGRCSHLHGHSYLWEVTATAKELSSNGMVVDFKDLKNSMNAVLDPLDHALVIAHDDPMLAQLDPSRMKDWLRATNGEDPRFFVWPENPTAESFAKWAGETIQEHLLEQGGAVVRITKVRVWETATSFAEWRRHDR